MGEIKMNRIDLCNYQRKNENIILKRINKYEFLLNYQITKDSHVLTVDFISVHWVELR